MAAAPLRERLVHIIAATDQLNRMWTGKTLADFASDEVLAAASERFLERICEAAKHIPDSLKAVHGKIPWPQIRGLGNRLRHGYDAIDPELLWDVITTDLAPLKAAVVAMLANEDEPPHPSLQTPDLNRMTWFASPQKENRARGPVSVDPASEEAGEGVKGRVLPSVAVRHS